MSKQQFFLKGLFRVYIYSNGTSLKRTLTVSKVLSALERCPPWRGFAYFDKKKVENSVLQILQSREPIRLIHIPLLPTPSPQF